MTLRQNRQAQDDPVTGRIDRYNRTQEDRGKQNPYTKRTLTQDRQVEKDPQTEFTGRKRPLDRRQVTGPKRTIRLS